MGKPVAPAKGIAFAFPDVCNTPAPPGPPVPIPYPNVADLSAAKGISNSGGGLLAGGDPVLLLDSAVDTSTGDEAGSVGGVTSGTIKGKCVIVQASGTVLYGASGKGIARFMDQTTQNNQNAQGMVLSAFPTVLVGE